MNNEQDNKIICIGLILMAVQPAFLGGREEAKKRWATSNEFFFCPQRLYV
jgi:hypothetical protein